MRTTWKVDGNDVELLTRRVDILPRVNGTCLTRTH
jgi:hypothetical protein